MKNREEIISLYLAQFNSYIQLQKAMNLNFELVEDDIIKFIDENELINSKFKDEFRLSENEKTYLMNKIKSIHQVHQDDGYAILGDYDHDYEWYNNLLNDNNFEEYYWDRYKNYLLNEKHFSQNIVDVLENNTLKNIMSYIGNPNEKETTFSIRGLVVGDVQSGKTSNYLGLVTKAADAGYKVIFILTGTIESLRKQTQIRVEEGFIGYDSVNGVDVGVKRGKITPRAFTSRSKDFVSSGDQNTAYKLSAYSSEPIVFVVKKNVSVLRKIYTALKTINTTSEKEKIDFPMIMIDDEADNASVNTNKEDNDPTIINKHIRKILSLFTKNTYVGFTATPFANVFISYDEEDEMLKDDLFPRDFIYALNTPSNYCGSKRYFFEKNENVKYITDYDDTIFDIKHKKDWNGEKLFGSVYNAINTFLLANVIRDVRDIDKSTHRSMLINMSRFTKVQEVIKEIVENYFNNIKKNIKQCSKLSVEKAETNEYVASLKKTFSKEYGHVEHNGQLLKWEDIFPKIYDSINNIKIIVVNSSKNSEKLNYDDHPNGLRVIAIGGLALSRGLTLEGLCCSYFYRNTATFDVLMQMGRWFGYREGYDDLCKIYITETSADYYKEICNSIECLKNDIRQMGLEGRKPTEFGIRVRNESVDLNITASNKMRNTMIKIVRKSFYGSIFETPYLNRDLQLMKENIENTVEFLRKISPSLRDNNVNHPYFRNVNIDNVINFLKKLNIHEANAHFDTKQITTFILEKKNDLVSFDVLVMGGQSEKQLHIEEVGIQINLVQRSFDISGNNTIVRMNKHRTRLGGRGDAKNGLDSKVLKELNIDENAKQEAYMGDKNRNPLLIIYFVEPHNNEKDNNNDEKEFLEDFEKQNIKYLVGYGIGFPARDYASSKATLYTVNKKVNYYEHDHERYYDEEGEEDNNE